MVSDPRRNREDPNVGQLEHPIEKETVKLLRAWGWDVIKLEVTHWPDRMAVSKSGVVVFIEFKRPGGRVRPGQAAKIRELRARGVQASIQDDVEEAFKWAIVCDLWASSDDI